jgi:DNA-binding MarR family transcriptional regulator
VSSGEAVLLGVLRDEPLTMSGVMQALHIKASTATSLVSRLESAGLVSRSRNPADRRSLLVTITPAGEALWARAEPVFAEFDGALSKASGAQAVNGFRAVLRALSAMD